MAIRNGHHQSVVQEALNSPVLVSEVQGSQNNFKHILRNKSVQHLKIFKQNFCF